MRRKGEGAVYGVTSPSERRFYIEVIFHRRRRANAAARLSAPQHAGATTLN
jgi:hypothetical protein